MKKQKRKKKKGNYLFSVQCHLNNQAVVYLCVASILFRVRTGTKLTVDFNFAKIGANLISVDTCEFCLFSPDGLDVCNYGR